MCLTDWPIGPVGPGGPRMPGSPLSPLAPEGPCAPLNPLSPFGPTTPWMPVAPVSPCCPFTPRSPFNPFCPLGPSLPCVWYTNIYQSVFPHMCICVYIHTWVYCSHVKECPWVVHCTYPPKSGGWAFFEHFCIHLRKRIHICVCNCACWLASATLNNNHLFVSLRCISV